MSIVRELLKDITRSPEWSQVRKEFLKENPRCTVCDKKAKEVHHILPFHLFPELELDVNNLMPFCRRHHFMVGHLENWRAYNDEVKLDAQFWRERLSNAEF